MALSEFEEKRIQKIMDVFIERHRPSIEIRDQLDHAYTFKGQSIEIYELRPYWNDPSDQIESPIAKITYVKSKKNWKLFWQRADQKWHGYEPHPVFKTLEECLDVIDKDEYCCFWG